MMADKMIYHEQFGRYVAARVDLVVVRRIIARRHGVDSGKV